MGQKSLLVMITCKHVRFIYYLVASIVYARSVVLFMFKDQ